MIYRMINGEQAIANTIADYNIDNADWIAKCPKWINDCLDDLKIISDFETFVEDIQIIDNKVLLPCAIKSLKAVQVNDIEFTVEDTITGRNSDEYTYTILNNSYILFNTNLIFTNGSKATIYYKMFPLKLSSLYNIYIPSIPDNQDVMNAISMFILTKYLQNGYTHKVFNLNNNNPYTNPALAYNGADGFSGLKLKARNSVKKMDRNTMLTVEYRQAMLNNDITQARNTKFGRNV